MKQKDRPSNYELIKYNPNQPGIELDHMIVRGDHAAERMCEILQRALPEKEKTAGVIWEIRGKTRYRQTDPPRRASTKPPRRKRR